MTDAPAYGLWILVWQTFLGWEGDPHLNLLHLLSNGVILY